MIPLRDSSTKRRFTPINTVLILANLAVFAYELSLGSQIEGFVRRYALIPAQLGASLDGFPWGAGPDTPGAGLRPILTLVTSMFVHGGVLHVAGNMLYLFIFGAGVEWRLGSLRCLGFYLAAGIAAVVAAIFMAPQSEIRGVGQRAA